MLERCFIAHPDVKTHHEPLVRIFAGIAAVVLTRTADTSSSAGTREIQSIAAGS